jgi:hypothetical protein
MIRAAIINLLEFRMEAIFVEKTSRECSTKPATGHPDGLFFDW